MGVTKADATDAGPNREEEKREMRLMLILQMKVMFSLINPVHNRPNKRQGQWTINMMNEGQKAEKRREHSSLLDSSVMSDVLIFLIASYRACTCRSVVRSPLLHTYTPTSCTVQWYYNLCHSVNITTPLNEEFTIYSVSHENTCLYHILSSSFTLHAHPRPSAPRLHYSIHYPYHQTFERQ